MPKITEITVHAGRVVPHPFESYANLKPGVTYKAALEDGEDPVEATKALQAQAESLLSDHINHMIKSLNELEDMRHKAAKTASLQDAIRRAQMDLDRLREGMPALNGTIADNTYDPLDSDHDDDKVEVVEEDRPF